MKIRIKSKVSLVGGGLALLGFVGLSMFNILVEPIVGSVAYEYPIFRIGMIVLGGFSLLPGAIICFKEGIQWRS